VAKTTILQSGDLVRSERFGIGRAEFDKGLTVIVRFGHGLEECAKEDLRQIPALSQALEQAEWHSPLEVITRLQAEAIQSVNDAWGVFSLSRIALLPHQLWVCRRVLATWPTRWLVADDVGLGKTIEAGLVASPLIARGTVRRLLVICPASLVEQWQHRLRTMFDIRLTRYTPEADTPRADFWNSNPQVVASLQTLREDYHGRQERLLASEPWDMVFVDEAHHLNADEKSGPTLGYQLVEKLVTQRRANSMVFFTGTPHRGKDYGFLSLLSLLRPELFDPQEPLKPQLQHLREVMIRNNKQNVTDLKGQRLFLKPLVRSETYRYSPAEARFYHMLTTFILTGRAYASSLSSNDGRSVMLVLVALQKLASSSVAAVRRALKNRLQRITGGKGDIQGPDKRRVERYLELEQRGDEDDLNQLDEELVEKAKWRLMLNEVSRLNELIAAADEVIEETKANKIIAILDNEFADRPVLLFTEYKATQSLLLSAINRHFGDGLATFINGDDRADEVADSRGRVSTIYESREAAVEKFNSGAARFLVSTEAGGEGIDLQERCHSLIHADLPWNPMRLHQRVGRLNRYGQSQQVEVVSLRNPETVEAIIWEKLNTKLDRIMSALSQVMDEPEDLLQLVLGMASPVLFHELFAEAHSVPRESLSTWFDQKTASFGGQDALQMVRSLVGHCARFDFQEVEAQIPRLDLPALRPFFVSMLVLNGRRGREDDKGLAFRTPGSWLDEPGVRSTYTGMVFRRDRRMEAAKILGVGHLAMDQALRQATRSSANVASIDVGDLARPLLVYRITDRITSTDGAIRSVIVGVEVDLADGRATKLLMDWQLLERLNQLTDARGIRRAQFSPRPQSTQIGHQALASGSEMVGASLGQLDLPFKLPSAEPLALLWPVPLRQESLGETEDRGEEID